MMFHSRFEVKACGMILHRGKILLVRVKGKRYFFLPGGHVEFRESARETIVREIKEEFGLRVRTAKYIGAVENVFSEHSTWHHELILMFSTTLASAPGAPIEPHLESALVDPRAFAALDVRPRALRDALVAWHRNRKGFFTTELPRRR